MNGAHCVRLSQGQTAMMWHSTGNLTAVKKNASLDFGVAEPLRMSARDRRQVGVNFISSKIQAPKNKRLH